METFPSDLDRFRAEVRLAEEAQTKQQYWFQKATRHENNLKAWLQLILSTANESRQPVPQDVLDQAAKWHLHHLIPHASIVVAQTPPTHDPIGVVDLNAHQNTSDWILSQVAQSGRDGIDPPEILKRAKAAGKSMHQNYPYAVLRNAVDAGKILKKGLKYLPKDAAQS